MEYQLHMGTRRETILFLCEHSEETARPWQEQGFSTICIDLDRDGQDVRLIRFWELLELTRTHAIRITGSFAMPPCNHLALSGAR